MSRGIVMQGGLISGYRISKKTIDIVNENDIKCGDVLTWDEVSEIHKIRNGVYQQNGRLISLLTDFGKINPCYPDLHGDTRDTIFYTGAGRRGDQKLDSFNQALLNAIDHEHSVPLFNKLAPGKWEFTGMWKVTAGEYIFDESQSRMIWKFTLRRTMKKLSVSRKSQQEEKQ